MPTENPLAGRILAGIVSEIANATQEEKDVLIRRCQHGISGRTGRRTVNNFLRLIADKIEGGHLDRFANKASKIESHLPQVGS